MTQLIFDRDRIPRTTTRAEWRAIDRWRRVTERQLREDVQKAVDNLVLFGTTHPDLFKKRADELALFISFPPVMMYPPSLTIENSRFRRDGCMDAT